MVPTTDKGWFWDMSTLVLDQRRVFDTASLLFILGLAGRHIPLQTHPTVPPCRTAQRTAWQGLHAGYTATVMPVPVAHTQKSCTMHMASSEDNEESQMKLRDQVWASRLGAAGPSGGSGDGAGSMRCGNATGFLAAGAC